MDFQRIADIDLLSDESASSDTAVIILHGYGANYNDFVPFTDALCRDREVSWFFPNGILPTMTGSFESGRCWYPIDMVLLQNAIMSGSISEHFEERIPDGMLQAASAIAKLLTTLKDKYEKIYLGGFSQGSMISSLVAFKHPELVSKLFLLSSTFVARDLWKKVMTKESHFPIFQAHGVNDQVLPLYQAEKLRDFLTDHDQELEYHEFSGGHEVPIDIVNKLDSFLNK